MPLYASAFFVPTSAGVPYILEDIYLRGGYRSVATVAERDAIKPAARKQGMVVFVREDSTIYWIPGATTAGVAAWALFDITRYVNFDWQEPLSLEKTEDGKFKVSIDEKRTVPVIEEADDGFVLIAVDGVPTWVKLDALPDRENAAVGEALILGAEKKPVWGKVESLPEVGSAEEGYGLVLDAQKKPKWARTGTRSRQSVDLPLGTIIAAGQATAELQLAGAFGAIVRLAVSHPDLLVEVHQSADMTDSNPFSFLSSSVKLEDDGTTVTEDGEIERTRRYGFFGAADLAAPKAYIKVVNQAPDSVEPTVSLTFLPME